MSKYKWISNKIPNDLTVKQVYGIVFSDDGRILLRVENNKYQLTGGKPELNESFEETLKREYLEEVNIEIDSIYYLGYLLVYEENEITPYAQVRMIAKIKNIGDMRPDIDNGKTYQRFLSNTSNVKRYLNYSGNAGNHMIDDAIKLSKEKYYFNELNDKEKFI